MEWNDERTLAVLKEMRENLVDAFSEAKSSTNNYDSDIRAAGQNNMAKLADSFIKVIDKIEEIENQGSGHGKRVVKRRANHTQ